MDFIVQETYDVQVGMRSLQRPTLSDTLRLIERCGFSRVDDDVRQGLFQIRSFAEKPRIVKVQFGYFLEAISTVQALLMFESKNIRCATTEEFLRVFALHTSAGNGNKIIFNLGEIAERQRTRTVLGVFVYGKQKELIVIGADDGLWKPRTLFAVVEETPQPNTSTDPVMEKPKKELINV